MRLQVQIRLKNVLRGQEKIPKVVERESVRGRELDHPKTSTSDYVPVY